MIRKINTICFIVLFLFLIGAVNAQDLENETAKITGTQDEGKIEQSLEKTELISANNVATTPPKEKVDLGTSNVNMYYKDGSKFTATLKDKDKKAIGNAKIKITISGKTYFATTDKKGLASLNINLKSGKYSVLTEFDGTSKYEKQSAKNTVIIKSTIKCSDFKKIYKNPGSYTATFNDKKGKVLKNTAVKFKICSKTYSAKTDKSGIAKLNINLKPGKYSISCINTKTSEMLTKTITITPPITENRDLVKYYKNPKEFSAKIITPYGKSVGSGKQVIFTINGVNYKKMTDKSGYARINVNLKPGTYTIKTTYESCSVTNKIQIKSLIESKDLTMDYDSGKKFSVKIYTNQGKAAPNQKVAMKIVGKSYPKTTNANGIASLDINLEPGTYTIVTEYGDLKSTNKIIVNRVIKKSDFTHTMLIPNYVNLTIPYVFQNSLYSVRTGFNGIVKLPKIEVFSIEVASKQYMFSTVALEDVDSKSLEYNSYLIPFDGSGLKSDINKNNLKGNGIIISRTGDYTQIDYVSKTSDNTELFGIYADKGLEGTETIKYIQNEKITAKITFLTYGYDEYGLRYSLAKYCGKSINQFSYSDLKDKTVIKFLNTNEPVTLSLFESYIVGYVSNEDIITKFNVNNHEELEKHETISYGLDKRYRNSLGFEMLQSYAIINEKITRKVMNDWLSKSSSYLQRFGVMNVYGMFIASLETCWIADEMANIYSKELNVKWKRENTLTIVGGINLEDTYLHVLNADMGMKVTGNDEKNVVSFKFLNSITLPYIEDYALEPVSSRYLTNTSNSLDNVVNSVIKHDYSTVKLGDLLYVFSEDGTGSAIILNCSNGVASVIVSRNNAIYKGSSISTSNDCCSVGIIPNDLINGAKKLIEYTSNGFDALSKKLNNIYPVTKIVHVGLKYILGKGLSGASLSLFNLLTFMEVVQVGGNIFREEMIDEKDWYAAMDTVTFTRPGYFQGKKIYNIPTGNGKYDYIEVKINSDLSLDRESAMYISEGNVRPLSKAETYNYFTEDYWSPFSVPEKYWDKSWKGG